MWLQQRLKGLPGLLSSSWARRVLLGLLLFLIFYWYLASEGGGVRFFSLSRDASGVAGACLQADITRWRGFVERGEGLMRSPSSEDVAPFVVGNGHFLVDVETNRLWVSPGVAQSGSSSSSSSSAQGPAPVLQTDFAPNVRLQVVGKRQEARALMLWFRQGSVVSVRCVQLVAASGGGASSSCVTVREEYVAHRSRPNAYLQRLHISNPSERPLTLDLVLDSPGFHSSVETLEGGREVTMMTGKVAAGATSGDKSGAVVAMVVAIRRPATRLQVAAKGELRESVLSTVLVSEPLEPGQLEEALTRLKDAARRQLQELLHVDAESLVQEHQRAWMELSTAGVEMKKIMDAHTPSSHTVNTTLYYILSASAAPLLDGRVSVEERERLESSLNYADHCFSGHATMHAETLWPGRVSSVAQVLQLLTLWRLTLLKRGCKLLVAAGVHGMLQGMVLSFGGLQFTENHLQFQADPEVLHNSYALRGIRYNRDLMSLAVVPDAEGKPTLHLSVKPQDTPVKLYACEAGCMGEVVELTSEVKGHTFPVLVTRPITPLLYISTDQRHLQDLRHTLHVKSILAHEEHMARQYPGLPFLFWFSVASLIILFHLFLFKLIYNEYCGPGAKPLFRSKVVRMSSQETDP